MTDPPSGVGHVRELVTCGEGASYSEARHRALEWICANVDHFDPLIEGHRSAASRAQPFTELALSLFCWTRHGDPVAEPFTARVLDFIEKTARKEEFTDNLIRVPSGLVLLIYVHASLRLHGRERSEHQHLILRAIEAGMPEQNEALPFRIMDLRMALDWAGVDHQLPTWDRLCEASILGRRLSVPWLEASAAYALTHAIFYVTEFGITPFRVTGVSAFQLREHLSGLLVSFLGEGHWDLVGELLLSWDCLGFQPTLVYERAWGIFLQQQEDDGAFRGPERHSFRMLTGKEVADPNREQFLHRYHTTLVAILALSCRGARKRNPQLTPPVPDQRCEPGGSKDESYRLSVRAAALRSRQWLVALWNGLDAGGGASPNALCHILAGLWMVDQITEGQSKDLAGELDRGQSALIDWGDSAAWTALSAGLKILCGALLRRSQRPVPYLDSFLDAAAEALRAHASVSAKDDLQLSDKRAMLHALGILPVPTMLQLHEVVAAATSIDLRGGVIEDLILQVDSFTGLGLRVPEKSDELAPVVEVLAGLAVRELRAYRLFPACTALRALSRLGPNGRSVARDGCYHLLLQQRASGSFGFFGPEAAAIEGEAEEEVSAAIDIYLPTTFECLWTLAEGIGDWSLVAALGRQLPSVRKNRKTGRMGRG